MHFAKLERKLRLTKQEKESAQPSRKELQKTTQENTAIDQTGQIALNKTDKKAGHK